MVEVSKAVPFVLVRFLTVLTHLEYRHSGHKINVADLALGGRVLAPHGIAAVVHKAAGFAVPIGKRAGAVNSAFARAACHILPWFLRGTPRQRHELKFRHQITGFHCRICHAINPFL